MVLRQGTALAVPINGGNIGVSTPEVRVTVSRNVYEMSL